MPSGRPSALEPQKGCDYALCNRAASALHETYVLCSQAGGHPACGEVPRGLTMPAARPGAAPVNLLRIGCVPPLRPLDVRRHILEMIIDWQITST